MQSNVLARWLPGLSLVSLSVGSPPVPLELVLQCTPNPSLFNNRDTCMGSKSSSSIRITDTRGNGHRRPMLCFRGEAE
jgi:hypothetical protein